MSKKHFFIELKLSNFPLFFPCAWFVSFPLLLESIDEDEAFDINRRVVIERFESKSNKSNPDILNLPSDELTQKMREAHFAKEQQKKHKCPHCDKFFMFPSKVVRHVNAVHRNLEEPKKNIRKNHLCNICGKAFVSQFKVRRHMVVHDTELKMVRKIWIETFSFVLSDKNFDFLGTSKELVAQLLPLRGLQQEISHSIDLRPTHVDLRVAAKVYNWPCQRPRVYLRFMLSKFLFSRRNGRSYEIASSQWSSSMRFMSRCVLWAAWYGSSWKISRRERHVSLLRLLENLPQRRGNRDAFAET